MSDVAGIGYWQLSIIMVVIASWILYRYVVPSSWREWGRAGLVQAFIIALYAEMYGFPLTLYLLSGFLDIDIPIGHESGHLWAALFGLGPVGAMVEMALGYALVFLGVALLAEAWREVYRARRQDRLATDGLYAVVRHPQYLGIFLAVLGQLVHWPTVPTLALAPVIVWAYWSLARREEHKMIQEHGDRYRRYRQEVPMLLPDRGGWRRLLQAVGWARRDDGGEGQTSR